MSSKQDMFEMIKLTEIFYLLQDYPPSDLTREVARKWVEWLDKKDVAWRGAEANTSGNLDGIRMVFERSGRHYEIIVNEDKVVSFSINYEELGGDLSDSKVKKLLETDFNKAGYASKSVRKEAEELYHIIVSSEDGELEALMMSSSDTYCGKILQYGKLIDIAERNDDYKMTIEAEIEVKEEGSFWGLLRVWGSEVKMILNRGESRKKEKKRK